MFEIRPDPLFRAAMRRYVIRFNLAMAAYALLIVMCLPWVKRVDWVLGKIALALLPLLPVAYAVRELVRVIGVFDELQRRIQFEAIAVSSLITCFGTLAWGLLEKAGLPVLPVVLVTPLFCGIYGIALVVISRRYR